MRVDGKQPCSSTNSTITLAFTYMANRHNYTSFSVLLYMMFSFDKNLHVYDRFLYHVGLFFFAYIRKEAMLLHSPISRRYIGESVVLPDQLVGPVVLVGDGSRPLGYGGYVPVVVVGVFVGVVAAVRIGA